MIGGIHRDVAPRSVGVVVGEFSVGVLPILIVGDGCRSVVAIHLTSITEPHEREHNVTLILGDGVVIHGHLNSVTERLKREGTEGGVRSDVDETSLSRLDRTRHSEEEFRLNHHTTRQHGRLGGGLDVESNAGVAFRDGVIHGGSDVLSALHDGIFHGVGCGENVVQHLNLAKI